MAILPNKHLKMYESLIFLSGLILKMLSNPTSIENIWQNVNKINKNKKYNTIYSFDKVIKAVDMLYIIGLININKDGLLEKCD
ncbi:ABC-three component system middle component 6 [Brachyspira hampsonii]|uniref:Uncharacterized protein n=1 Tax=Brachyspira hampsonii TaxID=1287055 RepID=A0AAC9TWT9_9SPIR|nr:ABC-three component system middle component 6 [Brachyspira hampsonii]ASJ22494.1 hypothetical protein BHAMNSH16_12925 [Brachyspira hampsonii]ELV06041.1 hypothetical protein H263_06622 [Brachyspira hampsonii 30599]OEJ16885.1 hypothetical protein A9496_12525 [Brachyspira hampsonii]